MRVLPVECYQWRRVLPVEEIARDESATVGEC